MKNILDNITELKRKADANKRLVDENKARASQAEIN